MISHYESVRHAALYPEAFNLTAPDPLPGRDIWPRRPAVFIRQTPATVEADVRARMFQPDYGEYI